MAILLTSNRLQYTRREVLRYREESAQWQNGHHTIVENRGMWEDIVAKANFLFGRIERIDNDVQESMFTSGSDLSDLSNQVRALLREWLDGSLDFLPSVEALEKEQAGCDGVDVFRGNIRNAQALLTSDEEFFQGQKLIEARDRALDEFRAGTTDSLLPN